MPKPIMTGLGSERLTVDNTAGGVALASIPQGATHALMRVKTAAICWTDDGATSPTSSVGMETEAGEIIEYDGLLKKFKAIRRDAASATLIVNYYGPSA